MLERFRPSDLPKKTRALILFFTTLTSLVACNSDLENNSPDTSNIKQTLTPTLVLDGEIEDAYDYYNQLTTEKIASKFYVGAKVQVITNPEEEVRLSSDPSSNNDNINIGSTLTFENAEDVFNVSAVFIKKENLPEENPREWLVYVQISNENGNGWIKAELLKIIPELKWQISAETSPFEKNTVLIPTVDYLEVKAKPLDHNLELITTFGQIKDFGDGDFLFTTEDNNIYIDPSGRKLIRVGFRSYRGYVPLENVEADPRFED